VVNPLPTPDALPAPRMPLPGEIESAVPPPPKVGAKGKVLRLLVMFVLLAVAVYLLLPEIADLRETGDRLKTMRWWALGLAAAAQIASYVAQGLAMRWVVALTRQKVPLYRATCVTLAAWSVGFVAGGMVGFAGATYRWMRDFGIRVEGALLAGWLPVLLNAAAVGVAAVVGTVELVVMGKLSTAEWIAFLISAVIIVGAAAGVVLMARYPKHAQRAIGRTQAWWARVRRHPPHSGRVSTSVQRLFRALRLLGRWDRWRRPLFGSLLGVAFDVLCLWLVFLAARNPVTAGVLIAGYGLPRFVGKVAVVPGGVGIVEAMMVALYSAMGVDSGVALLVVLAYRVISFWVPNLAGFPLIPVLEATNPAREMAKAA
jgi:glycosyltransferase 2 family protein